MFEVLLSLSYTTPTVKNRTESSFAMGRCTWLESIVDITTLLHGFRAAGVFVDEHMEK